MKHLWAPWRMEFIDKAHVTKKSICIFCEFPKKGAKLENLILYKGEKAFIIMNRYPYSPGHLMVVPYKHTKDFSKLTPEEHTEIGFLVAKCIEVLKKEMGAQGFNVGMNLGDVAGAGIKDHLHTHVIPRWKGDTNCITVIGEVRVLPESLKASYTRLKKHFK